MLNKINHITPDLLLKPNHRFLRHALLQLAILLVTINILWDEPTHILPDRLWAWGVYLLMFNLTIYTNMYGLVPLFLLKGRTRLYLILIGLLIFSFVFSLGMLQVIAEGEGNDVPTKAPVWIGLISGIGSFALFMGGLTSLQLFKYRVENQRRIHQLEGATMAVELANLQNQINPHFLFNMLNNANIMAGEDARKSSYMLTKLNDLLRYQVDKGSVKLVPLKEDIGMLRDYLELEKVRRDRFSYTIFVEGNTALELPPLLFIPF